MHDEFSPPELYPALGSTPCGSRCCLTCKHITPGTVVHCTSNGNTFRIRATGNCKSRNVVYLIECKLCHLQYVGETQNALHIRMNGHRSEILDKRVSAHICNSSHSLSHLTIRILENMRSENDQLRKRRESFWTI